ncbi:thiamine phosphate synthase [Candidatus Pelagibacter bacterium nBUS_29]|uniref:thiamine phosphate synthase n=1 Tax=Candidatus Pelagibacter bacterium nBUS_29 TaxID=3374190 RepID=UPI003EC0F29C
MHVNLPSKYYFINKFDTNNIDKLDKNTGIILRNYSSENNLKTIINLKKFCKKKGFKFFLSNNVKLALKLNLDGAYIPSFNSDIGHLSYSLKNNFLIIGSAHNNKEIKVKEKQLVKIIFLSSIFKKNKNYLGINKFKLFAKFTKIKVVALGGISNKNLKKLKLLDCFGFAGISFFE